MPAPPAPPEPAGLTLWAAADLQDHLLMVSHDLDRLASLLAGACDTLLASFQAASNGLQRLRALPEALSATPATDVAQLAEATLAQLDQAVAALQFQDMAAQLLHHSQHRLRHCVDQLAQQAFADDADEPAAVEAPPLRPNPVAQHEMDAGSVELF